MIVLSKLSAALVFILLCVPPASGLQDSQNGPATTTASSVVASSHPRVRLAGFSMGAGVSLVSGNYPYFYGPAGYGWPWGFWNYPYLPEWGYSPLYYYPPWYMGFSYGDRRGEIRLQSDVPEADVYLNDGFAGKAKDLKTIWLDPGAYNLRLEAGKLEPFTQRIYVLSGKTLRIYANLTGKEP